MLCSLPIHFVPVKRVRPNECHYSNHAVTLADIILREQLWRIPIAVERTSLAVMDGHHRLEAARRLRLKYIPCLLLDYDCVKVNATRQGYLVNPHEIVRRARTGELYPPKTTHHRFSSPFPICNISVPLLQDPAVVSSLPASARFMSRYEIGMATAADEQHPTMNKDLT